MRVKLGLGLALLSAGCGNSYEPLAVLYPNSGATVTLASPGGTFSSGFSSATPYFTFNNTVALAPAAGFVTDVALEAGNTYIVSMYHSQRLQTQIGGLAASSVRKGDYLAAGAVVGTPTVTNQFRLTAYRDGAVSCPYFDMTAAVRAALVITGATCAN